MPRPVKKGRSYMPTYKDEKTGTWYCKFYYTDWQGNKKQKLKRGFKLQRDAKDWERQFLEQQQGSPDMSFSAMCALFLEDKKAHAKLSSYKSEKGRLEAWVIPYFKDKPLNSITAADIRKWQAELKTTTGANGKLLSPSYLHNIGKKVKSVQFWTREEFNRFIATFDKSDPFYTAFLVLYYTGMRIGELMALTFADVDLKAGMISINKTYHKIDGKTVITPPKTEKGNRTITIPSFLCKCLDRHMKRIYGATSDTLLFTSSKNPYLQHMKKHETLAGLRHIRLHDLRYSHASLLIELGFSALLVSERLGHENVSTTLDIYSHLFPSKQSEVADKLEKLYSSDNY